MPCVYLLRIQSLETSNCSSTQRLREPLLVDAPVPDQSVPVLWQRPAINSCPAPFCCTTVRTAVSCV